MSEDYEVLEPDSIMAGLVMDDFGGELDGATIGEDIELEEVVAMIRSTSDRGGA